MRAVGFEHFQKYFVVAWGHFHDLEPNVIQGRVKRIHAAPHRTRFENQSCLAGDVTKLVDAQPKVSVERNGMIRVHLETIDAYIRNMTDQFSIRLI